MKKATQDAQAETVAAFLAKYAPVRYQDGDITSDMAEQAWGLKRSATIDRLTKRVKAGELERIDDAVLPSGSIGTIWRIVKPGS